jgi:hypothetical protein
MGQLVSPSAEGTGASTFARMLVEQYTGAYGKLGRRRR